MATWQVNRLSRVCYRVSGTVVHRAKVIASQLRPAFSEGECENAGELGGVSYETLLLLVYASSTRKYLALSSTCDRGLWRKDDGTFHLRACANRRVAYVSRTNQKAVG